MLRHIPVVILTASQRAADIVQAYTAQADRYIWCGLGGFAQLRQVVQATAISDS